MRRRQAAHARLAGEELPEAVAVVVEHRLGAADVERHRQDVAADHLRVLVADRRRRRSASSRSSRWVRVENSRSRPRSSVTLATTATRIAGTAATTENSATMRTCSRAAARPRRRACTTCPDLAADDAEQQQHGQRVDQQQRDDDLVGRRIGVRSASTTKVTAADSSARPTAIGPSNARRRLARARRCRTALAGQRSAMLVMQPSRLRATGRARGTASDTPEGLDRGATDAFIQQCCRIATNPGANPATAPRRRFARTAAQASRWCGSPGCPGRGFSCAGCCG